MDRIIGSGNIAPLQFIGGFVMHTLTNRRSSFCTTFRSRRSLIKSTPIFLAEPLEARRLLSATATTLYSFYDEGLPNGIALDGKGNLYGITNSGGTYGNGTVWELAKGSTTFTTLYSFTGGSDGGLPGAIAIDSSGNLYGTTAQGGLPATTSVEGNGGTIWELPNNGGIYSSTVTTLYDFPYGGTDAVHTVGICADGSGDTYIAGYGIVWELAKGSNALSTLYSFTSGNDGSDIGGITIDGSGNLYGTTLTGGANGDGNVWELAKSGSTFTFSVRYVFTAYASGGAITMSGNGNIYGTADSSVWELACGNSTLATLYTFPAPSEGDGQNLNGITADGGGNLYGTIDGGSGGYNDDGGDGQVWGLANGSHSATALYCFCSGDEMSPYGIAVDSGGNLYGTCSIGGLDDAGIIWELTAGSGAFTTYSYANGGDGYDPAAITLDSAGDLFGTAISGATVDGGLLSQGADRFGSVWELAKGSSTFTNLYSFTDGADGAGPGGITIDARGNLYGTTAYGGTAAGGTIWELAKNGGVFNFTLLSSFTTVSHWSGVTIDSAGNLYGTSEFGGINGQGSIWELAQNGSTYTFSTRYSFTGGADGGGAIAAAIDGSGNLYGTAAGGGVDGYGTVWELTAGSNAVTTLYTFTADDTVGSTPYAITVTSSGNLYGTESGDESIFELPAVTPFQLYSTVYGSSSVSGALIKVSYLDGSQTVVGPAGQADNLDILAADPESGVLYGGNGSNILLTINPITGMVSGTMAITEQGKALDVQCLSFAPNGELYAADGNDQLGVVNLSTGVFSYVSYVAMPQGDTTVSMAFSSAGTLYAIVQNETQPDSQKLVTVVPLTGALSSQASIIGDYCVGDIVFAPDGQIYATNYSGALLKVDPATAVVTYLGNGDLGGLDDLAVETNVASVTVTQPSSQTARTGQSQSFNLGSFTECDAVAPFTVTVNWGDGTANTIIANLTTAGIIPLTGHTYASSGSDTVTETVTDSADHTSNIVTFAVNVATPAPTLSVLASFDGTNGEQPFVGVVLSGSTLYGTTYEGGAYGNGTVFSEPAGGGTPTVLASFNGSNGNGPNGVILSGGILYGTTANGGACGNGTVFSLPVAGGNITVLASFNGTDGNQAYGGVILSDGTLYGTTYEGGSYGNGTVFSVPVGGGNVTTLASFNGTDGSRPSGVILSGNTLYGTTQTGGANDCGSVFSLPVGGGSVTVLASFNLTDGSEAEGGIILSGNTLYGATQFGGTHYDGTVFSVPVDGGNVTTLASFNGTDGEYPCGVILSGSTLYGTTFDGGIYGLGAVFSVPVGSGMPTVLASFNGTDGSGPVGVILSGNTLYGTTQHGGTNGNGTVFDITGLMTSGATITVNPSGNQTATVGQNASFSLGSFAESNATAPYTVTINWGDGSANSVIGNLAVAGTIPATAHTYTGSGNDTVSVTVTDSGNSTSNIATFVVSVLHAVPITLVLSNLTISPSVPQGTAWVTFSGTIAAGSLIPPDTESVAITLNGVTQDATINLQGNFSTTFNTSALPASNSPYQVTYAYVGDAGFNGVTDNTTTTLLVMPTNGTQTPVYRLYSQVTKEHLYTADLNEYNTLGTRGWDQEGLAYDDYSGLITIGGVTTEPLYRLYNIPTQQHLWTTDPNEYNTLKNFVGTWSVDGISGYIFPANGNTSTSLAAVPGSAALYRMSWPFNPSADLHLWTTDLNEYNTDAATYGWTKEGVIGYVM